MISKGTGSALSKHFWNSSTYSSGNRVGLHHNGGDRDSFSQRGSKVCLSGGGREGREYG
jgi:hypothetical protein